VRLRPFFIKNETEPSNCLLPLAEMSPALGATGVARLAVPFEPVGTPA